MNDPKNAIDRRRFLRLGGAGLTTGALAISSLGGLDRLRALEAGAAPADVAYRMAANADATGLILVSVQLDGGLDFLNTVVPTASRYRDLRRGGALAADGLLALDADYALNSNMPNLASAWQRGDLAIAHGVGLPNGTLSHFSDTDVWTRGRQEAGDGTGWIARALDNMSADTDPLIAISVGDLSPTMYGPGWNGVALPDDGQLPWSAEFVQNNPGLVAAYQQMLTAGGRTGSSLSLAEQVRSSQQLVRDVADVVGGATDLERIAAAAELFEDDGSDVAAEGTLNVQLGLVADLINGGLPTRAYHVALDGFDTHGNQQTDLPLLLSELDSAIGSFQQRLGTNASKVVIATWTEFGRRPDWNGSGTDHGTAGTQLVVGPSVRGGHFGEPSPLDRFDHNDNFLVTTDFTSYLGGLVRGVLGVDPNQALPQGATSMELIS